LAKELLEEVVAAEQGSARGGGFLPALRQVANVAGLPGIVGHSLAMPDAHSGYGFSIGNVAAVDMSDPEAVVSPGGVGFDINCGVRLLRTNLTEEEVRPHLKRLAEELFKEIPVGVGSRGVLELSEPELEQLMKHGMQWLVDKGYAWPEDLDCCEEHGCMSIADPACVSSRAKW
jgi:tRNA-splicing ligase RtcB